MTIRDLSREMEVQGPIRIQTYDDDVNVLYEADDVRYDEIPNEELLDKEIKYMWCQDNHLVIEVEVN